MIYLFQFNPFKYESLYKRQDNILRNAEKIIHMHMQVDDGVVAVLNLNCPKTTVTGTMKVTLDEVLAIALEVMIPKNANLTIVCIPIISK